MIKQIIKSLNSNTEVSDWKIVEKTSKSTEQFYVLQKLETTRRTNIKEYELTIYHEYKEDGNDYLGQASVIINHKMSSKDLDELISQTLFSAKFVKNQYYELPSTNDGKKNYKSKPITDNIYQSLNSIADEFFKVSKEDCKFNAVELFFYEDITHIITSKGINLTKNLYNIMVEAIPSFDGEEKVELYKSYNYDTIDLEKVRQDAQSALDDVTTRYKSWTNSQVENKLANVKNIDVIIRNGEVKELFWSIIEDYSYNSVYLNMADKQIGDMLQENIKGDKLNISLVPSSKKDAFDKDGILLNPIKIVEDGKLINNFGGVQSAYYLGIKKPSGIMKTISVDKGKTPYEKLTKKPHIEVITMSGLQIERLAHYIGGEVRLAVYFDGKDYYPVSGFTFSGNFDNVLSTLKLSKETTSIKEYKGPKYVLLNNMEIL